MTSEESFNLAIEDIEHELRTGGLVPGKRDGD